MTAKDTLTMKPPTSVIAFDALTPIPGPFSNLGQLVRKCTSKLRDADKVRTVARIEFQRLIENIGSSQDLALLCKLVMKDSCLNSEYPKLIEEIDVSSSLDKLADLLEQHEEYARADALRLLQNKREQLLQKKL
jgi:hypothetical protein